jgi:hypothetical protein
VAYSLISQNWLSLDLIDEDLIMIWNFEATFLFAFLLSLLSACHSSKQESSLMMPAVKVVASQNYNLMLMKWNGNTWQPTSAVAPNKTGVNILIHGFHAGKRSTPCNYAPEEVFKKHGLQDFRHPGKVVSLPHQIKGDTYALMWDSRAGNPMELERILMIGRSKSKTELEALIDSDHIDDESDTDFFRTLMQFYGETMKDYQGPKPHIAGFSKGGHVAIKLAEYAHFKQTKPANQAIMPETIALLDPYVGPGWSNGNIGIKLIDRIKRLQDRNVAFVNIMTSEIYDANLLGIPLADTRFRDDLRKVVGEINFKRNTTENRLLGKIAPFTGHTMLDRVIINHARAPQIWYGSVLMCNQDIPNINSSPTDYQKLTGKYLLRETPNEVTDWIYSGIFNPSCGTQVASE